MNKHGAWIKCQIEDDETPYYNQDDVKAYAKDIIRCLKKNQTFIK